MLKLFSLVIVLAVFLAACTDDADEQLLRTSSTPTATQSGASPTPTDARVGVSSLKDYPFGRSLFVNAAELREIMGEPLSTRGKIELTFLTMESQTQILSSQGPEPNTYMPSGRFVVVYYSARNEADGQIQPMGQINDELIVVDSTDREWGVADALSGLSEVSAAAAQSKGYERPDKALTPGADYYTAVVFDVPTEATGLSLVWQRAQAPIPLQ